MRLFDHVVALLQRHGRTSYRALRRRFAPDVATREAATTELPASGLRGLEAERRQLTVLFCDVVGSTA